MEQAEDTCCGPNQTAASREGTLRTNTWEAATTLCPTKATHQSEGEPEQAFTQEPRQVPREPASTHFRRPCSGGAEGQGRTREDDQEEAMDSRICRGPRSPGR